MKLSGSGRRTNRRRDRHRNLRRLTTIAVSAAIGGSFAAIGGTPAFAADSPPAQGVSVLYSQNFTGTSTQAGDWLSGGKACLTAAKGKVAGGIPACDWKTPDKDGSGALSLTGDGQSQSGFALYQHPLTAGQGVDIQFDMYQYDSLKGRGADGMSFFLVDGSASPAAPGQPGRGLGYAGNGKAKPGLKGAILGVGFDEYGNFSVAGDGHKGGAKKSVPDAVVARGSESTQYAYIDGKTSPVTFWFDSKTRRADAKVHVEIKISPANDMTVLLGSKVVLGPLDLSKVPGQPPLPATFKFGFAASTGGNTAIHEISGLSIDTLPPSLTTAVSHSGDFTPGGTGTITAVIGNAKTAGPTNQLVTATIPVPAGLTATAASGTGWTCAIGDGQVTCTRSDSLKAGASYPPIGVSTSVAPSATGTIPVTASAGTPAQPAHSGSSATDKIVIQAAPLPHVTTSISPVGSFTAPGTATYQANVTDGSDAGPVTGTTTETFDVPAGQTVSAAAGDGWTCTTSGQRVTCTTSATAAPGGGLPPVTVTAAIPSGATAPAAPTAAVTTAGQAGQSSAPVVSIPVSPPENTAPQSAAPQPAATPPAAKPSVTTTISPVGTFTSPGTGTYQANVTDAASAGPTTGTTTEVLDVPAGQNVTSATGSGWLCDAAGQQVTCATEATAQPGASLSPVSVAVGIPGGTDGPLAPTATVTTAGQAGQSSAPAVSIPVTPAVGPPSVTTSVGPVGTFTSPGTGTYQAVVTADPNGGPVTGTTTEVFSVPAGQAVTSATGPGWSCTTAGQQVTCTTSAKAEPGASLPPVTIGVGIAAGAAAAVSPTATATTAGQQGSSSAPPVSIPVTPTAATAASTPSRAPDLSARLNPKGALVSGQDGTIDLIVSNAAKAGPTTGTVTASYTVPNGSEVTKAAGDGWTCKVQRWLVSCTRPGDGRNALAAGGSYPPVALTSTLCQRAVCTLSGVTVQVATPGDAQPRGSTLSEDIAIQRQSSVQVTMISTPNPAVPGRPVTYTATISNAGPTDAAGTQLAIAVPFGFSGQWTCKASPDSACAEPIGMGSTTVTAYIAAGGTVTLTATGPASSGTASATVSLIPGYTDAECGQTCTATVAQRP
jgi:hypothetical protein